MKDHIRAAWLPLLLAALLVPATTAQQMRGFRAISVPDSGAIAAQQAVATPVRQGVIDSAVAAVAESWTNRTLGSKLADSLQQSSRLGENLELEVPRDAVMQVEAIRNAYTINQEIRTGPGGKRERVSTVQASVSTRLLLNDEQAGFVSVPGTNEVIFEIIEELD